MVCCGLLVEITVNDKYGPGDLVKANDGLTVDVRVFGPSWVKADRVELFVNGRHAGGAVIEDNGKAGVKWSQTWRLPRPKHDVHLVAVAGGPGVEALYWPVGKPYQPASPLVRKRVIGLTGAVWIDADGDGQRTSSFDYAKKVLADANGDWKKAVAALSAYDEAVAAQAAGLLRAAGTSPSDKGVRAAAQAAGEHVLRGFDNYAEAWRASQIARQDMK
jgi:hypothetical protein